MNRSEEVKDKKIIKNKKNDNKVSLQCFHNINIYLIYVVNVCSDKIQRFDDVIL